MKAMELPANNRCSIARSLEVLGQKWSLLIVREAFRGRTRFAEFQKIGVPTDLLASRLEALVDAGVLTRRPYQQPGQRTRVEYVLTPVGEDLLPVLAALSEWGDEHLPTGHEPSTVYVDTTDERPVHLAFVDADGTVVDPENVAYRRGPGDIGD
ncbi:winged helix-turn-helix transcriptional regulator [Amycolatopsis sp. NPDC051903]|uniref:winged helix-turn-helix transcriptional regulator n=1 Tax=Amycolatopsis sp. NPDC051903 TaxID=3363936 RepID=UPI0037A61011